jgi:HEAT repeat protein
LLEQLKSEDKGTFSMGLRVARELPGQDVTKALIAELDRSNPVRQNLLLRAVADRGDATVMPKLLELAKSSQAELRTTAIAMMDRFPDASSVPVLLNAAVEKDAELAKTAKSALGRLGGKEVDAELLARLPQSAGATRCVLIDLVTQRRIEGALPGIVKSSEDADENVRRAAIESIGVLGNEAQAADLARMLGNAQNSKNRDYIETALTSICGRSGAKCLPSVLPLAQTGSSDVRKIGLHALASIGGSEALNAVKSATNDKDEVVQDEGVSILSTWPNKWPEDNAVAEPLLALAKSGKKTSHQVQGLRGYLDYIQETKLSNEEKLAKLKEVQGLIQRPEEKRKTISVISSLSTTKGLEPLIAFAEDPVVAEEACMAIVKIADPKAKQDVALRRKALQTAVEKSKNANTKKKAEDNLSKLN